MQEGKGEHVAQALGQNDNTLQWIIQCKAIENGELRGVSQQESDGC